MSGAGSATIERMRSLLGALAPASVDIVDDSAKHAGHAGAKSGGGHYTLTIVAASFAGQNTVARHRAVYAALSPLMAHEIHALAIVARAPGE